MDGIAYAYRPWWGAASSIVNIIYVMRCLPDKLAVYYSGLSNISKINIIHK